jgi:dTDP-4-amino-4,6-dideoxygalactose transaminase
MTLSDDEIKIGMTELAPDPVQIPLFDLRLAREDIGAVAETLRSGWLTMGPRTQAFEEAFAEHLGVRHAVAVSSCTAALHLAYLAAGVGPGDEVIVPSFTFAATATAVVYCGGTPVFADIASLDDPSIDPAEVERLITPRTKAVGAVHFAGYAAPVDRLQRICDEHGLALVEDAAHTPSAELNGRKLGTFGLAGCFSLFSNKVLSVGEGGLLTTDDDETAALARLARSQGMTSGTWDRHSGRTDTYDVVRLGWNYRLDEPRSALAHSRLLRLEADIERRRELVRRYRERLAAVSGVLVPYRDEDVATSTCYVMPVMVDPGRRDTARTVMRDEFGVQTSIFYPAVHEFTVYRERVPDTRLPLTERAARSEITLPLFPHMTAAEQDRVVASLAEGLKR